MSLPMHILQSLEIPYVKKFVNLQAMKFKHTQPKVKSGFAKLQEKYMKKTTLYVFFIG